MKIIFPILLLLFLIPVFVLGAPPAGVDITLDSLLGSANSIGYFLYVAGGILASITIIGTGIMYLMAGGNATKMTGAKSMFKAGMIGALLIFSPGVIIGTVTGFSSNPLGFFGGGGTGGAGVPLPPPPPPVDIAYGCSSNNTCMQVAGGIFANGDCALQCGGAGGQAVGGSCNDCINQGNAFCLADSSCSANELDCPGVFTRFPGGCP